MFIGRNMKLYFKKQGSTLSKRDIPHAGNWFDIEYKSQAMSEYQNKFPTSSRKDMEEAHHGSFPFP